MPKGFSGLKAVGPKEAKVELIRAFIAIELPEDIKKSLVQLQDALHSRASASVRWVDPQRIHLTLKFLGNITSEQVAQVVSAMTEATAGQSSLSLETTHLGAFPNWQRPRVIWVGLGGEAARLTSLTQRLDELLAAQGFAREESYTPHLTLGRVRDETHPAERRRLGEKAQQAATTAKSFLAQELSLMRSQLTPQGAIYSRLASVPLERGD